MMRLGAVIFVVALTLTPENGKNEIFAYIGFFGFFLFLCGFVVRWREEAPKRKKRVEGWEIAEVTLVGDAIEKPKYGVLFVSFVTSLPLDCLTENIIQCEVQKFAIKYVNGKEEIKKCAVGSDEYNMLMEKVNQMLK